MTTQPHNHQGSAQRAGPAQDPESNTPRETEMRQRKVEKEGGLSSTQTSVRLSFSVWVGGADGWFLPAGRVRPAPGRLVTQPALVQTVTVKL